MSSFNIPEHLLKMVQERRIIPFIGAGFSGVFDLPDWKQLLKELSSEINDGLTFEDVYGLCDGNLLQIAEYFFLMKDRQIGPIRQKMSEVLHAKIDPVLSGAHVELVNLGAPLVYTTNYDNFIEKVFRNLDYPCETIALPRQVAYSDGKKTQIIKYHGDFSYDETLVLTESSYYSRMNFDSPLDLKFRSELFARSVLFIGYSFRDINIRIIWYRLMEMMKDIAATDRPDSYIVRINSNKVLEKLYEEVGIKTIVLDPKGEATTTEEQKNLLHSFVYELATRVNRDALIPGSDEHCFLSTELIRKIDESLELIRVRPKARYLSPLGYRTNIGPLGMYLYEASKRRIPKKLTRHVADVLSKLAVSKRVGTNSNLMEFTLNVAAELGPMPQLTYIIAKGMISASARELILEKNVGWDVLYGATLPPEFADTLITRFEREIQYCLEEEIIDHDIAYMADIAKRISLGQMVAGDSRNIQKRAGNALEVLSGIYPAVEHLSPSVGQPPPVDDVLAEIDTAAEKAGVDEASDEDDEE